MLQMQVKNNGAVAQMTQNIYYILKGPGFEVLKLLEHLKKPMLVTEMENKLKTAKDLMHYIRSMESINLIKRHEFNSRYFGYNITFEGKRMIKLVEKIEKLAKTMEGLN